MTHPDDSPPDEVDGCLRLGQLTDRQWLDAHRALIDSGAIPADELAYLYEPGRDPATVDPAELSTDRDPAEGSDG